MRFITLQNVGGVLFKQLKNLPQMGTHKSGGLQVGFYRFCWGLKNKSLCEACSRGVLICVK